MPLLTKFSGRNVIGSWYGEKPAEINRFVPSLTHQLISQVYHFAGTQRRRANPAASMWHGRPGRIKPEMDHACFAVDGQRAYRMLIRIHRAFKCCSRIHERRSEQDVMVLEENLCSDYVILYVASTP
jgi:hypothetical protein